MKIHWQKDPRKPFQRDEIFTVCRHFDRSSLELAMMRIFFNSTIIMTSFPFGVLLNFSAQRGAVPYPPILAVDAEVVQRFFRDFSKKQQKSRCVEQKWSLPCILLYVHSFNIHLAVCYHWYVRDVTTILWRKWPEIYIDVRIKILLLRISDWTLQKIEELDSVFRRLSGIFEPPVFLRPDRFLGRLLNPFHRINVWYSYHYLHKTQPFVEVNIPVLCILREPPPIFWLI